MEIKIKARIEKLFISTLKIIDKQSNCSHIWKDKDGSAFIDVKNVDIWLMIKY